MKKTLFNPKTYFSNGAQLSWGQDLTDDEKNRLKQGEVFCLLSRDKLPHSLVLMDSYNQIREGSIEIRCGWAHMIVGQEEE